MKNVKNVIIIPNNGIVVVINTVNHSYIYFVFLPSTYHVLHSLFSFSGVSNTFINETPSIVSFYQWLITTGTMLSFDPLIDIQ